MADPLSIATAGAGFLSLAGQVLDGIVKLRGFIATVDSAPREIHDLCHELDVFRGLLEEAGRRVQESLPMGVDASHLKDAFAHCEKMRGYAESMLKRLEVNINRSKTTTALRFTFKKKEIEGMLLGVERGKTSLLLANQSFESSLASRRHVALSAEQDLLLDQQRKTNEEIAQIMPKTTSIAHSHDQKFASITHEIAASTQASTAQTRDLKEAYTDGYRQIRTTLSQLQNQSTSISSGVTGQAQQTQRIVDSVFNAEHTINEVNARLEALSLQIASQTHIETTTRTTLSFRLMPLSITLEQMSSRKQRPVHVTKPKRTARLFTVRLPKWFLHRQYDLQMLYSTSGFPFMLNACRVVQEDSPFFIACETGDIDTIKVLLSNQQASIYDRTPGGVTAFHLAMGSSQLEVCKLLRHAGIFARFDYEDYHVSLLRLDLAMDDFTEHNRSLLHIAAPLHDPDRDWFKEYCRAATGGFRLDAELFSLLNSAQGDTAMLNLSHLRSYFESRIRSPWFSRLTTYMSYIATVLSSISNVREITAARDEYAWIVYALASEIAHEYLLARDSNTDLQSITIQWYNNVRQALCAVVRAGLNPHQTSGKLELPCVGQNRIYDQGATPLGLLCVEAMLLREASDQPRSKANAIMRIKTLSWLSGLHSAGIDLLQYAESESACYGHDPDLLVIPYHPGASITVVIGPRPEDWHVSLWEPCEFYARQFWSLVEGTPVVPELAARIIEVFPLSASQDPTSPDLPGSWPSQEARIAEELESWLLGKLDVTLAQIEEDLPLLSEADFFEKWYPIDEILGLRQ